jgi:methylmalonyl-CoA mutase
LKYIKKTGMRPSFKNIDYKANIKPSSDPKKWQKEHDIKKDWCTSEQIHVKPVYLDTDLLGMEHLNYAAGLPPYLRGPTAPCM